MENNHNHTLQNLKNHDADQSHIKRSRVLSQHIDQVNSRDQGDITPADFNYQTSLGNIQNENSLEHNLSPKI